MPRSVQLPVEHAGSTAIQATSHATVELTIVPTAVAAFEMTEVCVQGAGLRGRPSFHPLPKELAERPILAPKSVRTFSWPVHERCFVFICARPLSEEEDDE